MTTEDRKVLLHNALMMRVDDALAMVRDELERALTKHPPTTPWNPHCGYAVILEEVDELWEHVKADTGRGSLAGKEAIQISAMGVRYLVECVMESLSPVFNLPAPLLRLYLEPKDDARRQGESEGQEAPQGASAL